MYRTIKVLNNNAVLAVDTNSRREVILLGSGVGFGKKVSERFDAPPGTKAYFLQRDKSFESSLKVASSLPPVYLEIADELMKEAERVFLEVNTEVLLPLADHLAFAIKRIENNVEIHNPFTADIRVLFREDFGVALKARELIRQQLGIEINDDEVSYITLHLYSAREGTAVSQTMKETMLLRQAIDTICKEFDLEIDSASSSYSRLSSHLRYMISRIKRGELIKLDMNDYAAEHCPQAFALAGEICALLAAELGRDVSAVEIGYMAIHIERARGITN